MAAAFSQKDRARDRPDGSPIRREAIAFQPRAARIRYFLHHLYMAQLYRMFDLRTAGWYSNCRLFRAFG
jgi:hypothetical protein